MMTMINDLRVTIIQTELIWQDPKKNLDLFEIKIKSVHGKTDLIILPEMFTTGFTMDAEACAEKEDGEAVKQLCSWAKTYQIAICGSMVIKEKDSYYNRLYFAKPNGDLHHYDKRHLFRMAKEHEHYSMGTEKVIVNYKGWKIRPLICYDLRFPVWSRNKSNDYDLLIYVANWPSLRSTAWKSLLKARAIENLSYVVGVNRVGEDQNNIHYSGDSSLIDFKGDVLFEKSNDEVVHTGTFSMHKLMEFREKFPAHLDADDFFVRDQ